MSVDDVNEWTNLTDYIVIKRSVDIVYPSSIGWAKKLDHH